MNIIGRLTEVLGKEKRLNVNSKLLLAVSGGVDSMVLLDLFENLNFQFHVAHANFQLRDKQSEEDQILVQKVCDEKEIVCHTRKFDTSSYAKTQKVSIQMAARIQRYEWFHELLDSENLDFIVTAHHANDSIETAIFNFTKGTGVHGLKGISMFQHKRLSPLVGYKKDEIKEYAKKRKVVWREDESNNDEKYQRNLIRNKVVPILEDINPSVVAHFRNTSSRIEEMINLLDEIVAEIRSKHLMELDEDYWSFQTIWMKDQTSALLILSEILKEFGFSYSHSIQVFESITNQSGKEFYSEGFRCVLDRDQLLLKKGISKPKKLIVEGPGTYLLNSGSLIIEEVEIPDSLSFKSEQIAYLDVSKISYPLEIRNWEFGDSFVPLGMSGHKKVSDFMVDEKINLIEKEEQLVVLTNGEICWVVGKRIDDRFKIDDSTKRLLLMRFEES